MTIEIVDLPMTNGDLPTDFGMFTRGIDNAMIPRNDLRSQDMNLGDAPQFCLLVLKPI